MTPAHRSALRRWAVVAAGLAALGALPAVVAAVPASGNGDVSPTALLARVRTSAGVAYSGYAESRGTLALPKIPRLSGVDDLLSSTTRMRVWYADPARYRVDEVGLVGETDTYVSDSGTWRWESDERRATLILGRPSVRLPRGADLLPAELGRRLANAARPEEVRRLAARRIAGRTALGLRITPRDPTTTVGRVDLWADRSTGLPLRVDVSGRNAAPTLTTAYLDLEMGRPADRRTDFHPPADASLNTTTAPDIAAAVDRYGDFELPATLAGLPRRQRVQGIGVQGGTATYGEGYSLLTLLPLPHNIGAAILDSLDQPPATPLDIAGATAAALGTPLANVVVLSTDQGHFLLAGSVRPPVLERAAQQLVEDPPPYRPDAR
ncbi:MAG: sigma-E factor regulatory protein RseB domain-containing protein [Mycobacteriales bacterium]